MTKKISEAAGCSRVYTNHSLRATSVTSLDHAGYTSRDIMTVSGHRSESSIKHYVRTSEEMKRNMSKTLSEKLSTQSEQNCHDPPRNVPDNVENNKPTTSTSSTSNDVVDEDGLETFTDSQVERALNSLIHVLQEPLQDISNTNSNATVTGAANYSMNMVTSV